MSFCCNFLKIKLFLIFPSDINFHFFLLFSFRIITWPYCLIHSLVFGKRRFHFSPICKTSQFTMSSFLKRKHTCVTVDSLTSFVLFPSLQGIHYFMIVVITPPICQNQRKCWTTFRIQDFFGI